MSIRKISHVGLGVTVALTILLATSFGPLTVRSGSLELKLGRQPDGYALRVSTRGCTEQCQPFAIAWGLGDAVQPANPTRLSAALGNVGS